LRRGLFGGFRALRGATGALPLDPTTFEKVDETFILRSAPVCRYRAADLVYLLIL